MIEFVQKFHVVCCFVAILYFYKSWAINCCLYTIQTYIEIPNAKKIKKKVYEQWIALIDKIHKIELTACSCTKRDGNREWKIKPINLFSIACSHLRCSVRNILSMRCVELFFLLLFGKWCECYQLNTLPALVWPHIVNTKFFHSSRIESGI